MKKHSIVLRALLAAALLICATLALATSASAEATAESALSIEYANVAYQAKTRLAFTLKGTVAEGDTAGIAVWENGFAGEKTAENASYFSFEADTLDGKTFYLTDGIAADDMSYRISVAPCVKNSEGIVTLAGEAIEYSIYDYVKDRLDDEGVTDAQMKLYSNLVYYGNCAEKVIDGSVQLPLVVTKGGYVGNKTSAMLIADKDGEALIRANAVNANGESFLYWSTPTGEEIYDRVARVTPAAGNNVYTAVYGSEAESAYAGTVDFASLPTGQLSIVPATIGTPSYDSNLNIYYVQNNASFLGGALVMYYGRVQVTSDTDLTVVKTTELNVNESTDGTKFLSYSKAGIGGGQPISFTNKSGLETERIEMDMAYTSWSNNETTALHFFFNSKDCRIDVRYEANGDLYFFKNGTSTKAYAGNFALGERFTVSAEVNESGLVVLYVNGTPVTNAKDGTHLLDGFDFGLTAGTKYIGNKLWYESYSYDKNTAEIYAVIFVDTDRFGN